MMLFEKLRKIRDFERHKLPFLQSFIDFDIIIEIGYAEEREQPLTPKQLLLLNLTSPTTVRRKLTKLIEQGIVSRRPNATDQRSAFLSISAPNIKLLNKYCSVVAAICTAA